jgi:hypothetical protein
MAISWNEALHQAAILHREAAAIDIRHHELG